MRPSRITAIVVGHRHRLLLVVRDVHEGDPDLALDVAELELQLLAQAQVERAERLVEQQRARAVDERAGERDALLLAAGHLGRLALGSSRASCDELERPRRRGGATSALATFLRSSPNATFFSTVMCGNSA